MTPLPAELASTIVDTLRGNLEEGPGHGEIVMSEPDARIKRYFKWYGLRLSGWPEHQIRSELEQLGLGEFGSAEALYAQLANDGFPVCKTCGETPVSPEHCEKPKERKPGPPEGLKIDLPPAGDAYDLFRKAHRLLDDYANAVVYEKSWLQGRRFTTQHGDPQAEELFERRNLTEAEWRRLCERYGVDPDNDELLLPIGSAGVGRVGQAPSETLIALIAAYALAGLPMADLVEKLHPHPGRADEEDLEQKVVKLHVAADHLATLVRGGGLGKGNRPPDVTGQDVFLAWQVEALEEHGFSSDEELCERLKQDFKHLANRLTPNYVRRLRHLGIELPK